MAKTPEINLIQDYGRNYIINGNFDFWQRGTIFTSAANGAYTTDRFVYSKSGTGVHTIDISTDTPSSEIRYSLRLLTTTADTSLAASDLYFLSYRMEGNDLQSIAGKTITLSFYVKAPKAGVYCVAFRNGSVDRSFIKEYTVNTANTWERKSVSLTHDTTGTWNYNTGIGLIVSWTLAAGSNAQNTTDTWHSGNFVSTVNQVNAVDTVNGEFRISQIQITEGSEDLPFRRAGRTIGEELQLCQRYYQRGRVDVIMYADNGGFSGYYYPWITTMRATPTVSQTNLIAGGVSATPLNIYISNKGALFYRAATASSNHQWASDWTADAEL